MENNEKIKDLNQMITNYFEMKVQKEELEANMKALNQVIKNTLKELKLTDYTNTDGINAKISVATKYSYDEVAMVAYLQSINKTYALKLVPNLDIIKSELNTKALDEKIINSMRKTTITESLTVSKKG